MSSSETASTASDWTMLETRLRWLSITPLLNPVVPLEYGTAAMSTAGSNVTLGAASGSPSSSENDERPVGLAEHEHLTTSRLLRRLACLLEERRRRQQHPRAAVGKLMGQFARCVERVDGRAPSAGRNHTMKRNRVLRRVGHIDRERVALAEATRSEPRGETAHQSLQPGVAQHTTGRAVNQRRLLAQLPAHVVA